jgi:hypothetical protein
MIMCITKTCQRKSDNRVALPQIRQCFSQMVGI